MTTYRAGQRVRIEVEGILQEDGRESVLRILWGNGGGATFAVNGQPVHWVRDADITILSEPRPEEPTGLGAVVEAVHRDVSDERCLFVSIYTGMGKDRWSTSYGFQKDWADFIDPVVLSEGWTP